MASSGERAGLLAELSGGALLGAQARRDAVRALEAEVGRHDGTLVHAGEDSLVATFASAPAAARSARAMQRLLRERALHGPEEAAAASESPSPRLRVALAWGSTERSPDGSPGLALQLCSLVIQCARSGDVLATREVVERLPAARGAAATALPRETVHHAGREIEVLELPWRSDATVPLAPPAAAMAGRLRVRFAGRSWTLGPELPRITFGREISNTIVIDSEFASRHHGELLHREGGFVLVDRSTNGTVVVRPDGAPFRVHRETAALPDHGALHVGGEADLAIHFDGGLADRERGVEISTRAAAPPAHEGAARFCREGEYWTIAHGGVVIRLRDSKGLHQIAQLLRHPHREIHALELAQLGEDAGADPAGGVPLRRGPAEPILDRAARTAYRKRLAELREEVAEAAAQQDLGRSERLREEAALLETALARAAGLFGRDREAASQAERARVAVTRSIKAAIDRIRAGHPALARHLATSIRTGRLTAYCPEPSQTIDWQL